MTLAVITARAGSKGLVSKNSLTVGPYSLVQWAIVACKEAGIDPVVSTDCDRVRRQAGEMEVVTVNRPAYLCSDDAVTQEAVMHVVDMLNYKEDKVLLMQPATWHADPEDIRRCVKLVDHGFDWAATVTECHDFIVECGRTVTPYRWARRQDATPRYALTGAVYCYRVKDLVHWREMYYESILGCVPVPKTRAVNIDTKVDYDIACAIYQASHQTQRGENIVDERRHEDKPATG